MGCNVRPTPPLSSSSVQKPPPETTVFSHLTPAYNSVPHLGLVKIGLDTKLVVLTMGELIRWKLVKLKAIVRFLSFFLHPSSLLHLPYLGTVVDKLFQKITVNISNDADHDIQFMCGDGVHDKKLHTMKPGGYMSFRFHDIMFPLKWCYVYLGESKHGVFWAYAVKLRCIECIWSLRNDGIFLLGSDGEEPKSHELFLKGDYF
uniref:S-protein homolog n=1 Tax=Salix viminalis TaxID=40686 RepID=A0A6N2KTM5_SALVM